MTEEKNVQEETVPEEEVTAEAPVDTTPIDVDGDGLEQKVADLEAALAASEEKYLRLYAEFDNYKKRTRTELETEKTYRSQAVLRDVIPTLDNIERALAQKSEDETLIKGVQMVYDNLVSALKEHGLETIEAQDQPFDPNFHQAVMQEKDDSKESGIVLDELQKGYKLKERVLRPSMVKVNE
ncbi:nucleotide exchange factor GrpE [Macrococcus bovicus]|uniref:Protein GrpE n=1 Tax=Macrococcus bovicus TaxID=69968 RepID=A0A4R6C328_9STAP|nr:nucleotide exchange factor GrpE [Macrococcus bovicus]TDM15581.1 nucleotide exchange factor GrpE [Macrococcus bovicus]WJP96971.1 nucleotide exchange factor GrpE [Macrococcus bovicus]